MAKKNDVYMPLIIGDWYSPDTYSENFRKVPDTCGVYCFITLDDEVLYVGSAKNLKQRKSHHNLLSKLKTVYRHVFFMFWEVKNYKEEEIKLIRTLRPKYNVQHNGEKI